MTSRERVLRAFEHREPDHIPVDFSGHRSSGIAAIAYARLREALGFPQKKVQVYDPIQQLAIVDEEVRARFFVDTQEMGRGFAREDKDWNDWTLPDGAACQLPAWVPVERRPNEWVLLSKTGTELGRMPDGALYFEQTNYPFLESEDLSSLRSAFEQSMWLSSAGSAPPGPVTSQELKQGAAGWASPRTRPLSAFSEEASSRRASFSTATTTSTCSLRQNRLSRGLPGCACGSAPGKPAGIPGCRGGFHRCHRLW